MSDLEGVSVSLNHGSIDSECSPGAVLKRAREQRGVSLEKMASHLRLSQQTVIDIEADEPPDNVPPAYWRGYYRSYALAMGLDPSSILPPVSSKDHSAFVSPAIGEPSTKRTLSHVRSRVAQLLPTPQQRMGAAFVVVGVIAFGALSLHHLLDRRAHNVAVSDKVSGAVPVAKVSAVKAAVAATKVKSVITKTVAVAAKATNQDQFSSRAKLKESKSKG